MTTTAAVIRKARELIEADGWVQGSFRSEDGYCLGGAISEAAYRLAPDGEIGITSLKATGVFGRVHGALRVTAWNDDPTRTEQEVIDMLDRMIEYSEEQA